MLMLDKTSWGNDGEVPFVRGFIGFYAAPYASGYREFTFQFTSTVYNENTL